MILLAGWLWIPTLATSLQSRHRTESLLMLLTVSTPSYCTQWTMVKLSVAGWQGHTPNISYFHDLRKVWFKSKNTFMTPFCNKHWTGKPPLTSTATLNIHVTDQNDNVPQLTLDYVDVCVSDEPTTINITAIDLDENPFGGPFTFKLLGDVEGKWTLNPSFGTIGYAM